MRAAWSGELAWTRRRSRRPSEGTIFIDGSIYIATIRRRRYVGVAAILRLRHLRHEELEHLREPTPGCLRPDTDDAVDPETCGCSSLSARGDGAAGWSGEGEGVTSNAAKGTSRSPASRGGLTVVYTILSRDRRRGCKCLMISVIRNVVAGESNRTRCFVDRLRAVWSRRRCERPAGVGVLRPEGRVGAREVTPCRRVASTRREAPRRGAGRLRSPLT